MSPGHSGLEMMKVLVLFVDNLKSSSQEIYLINIIMHLALRRIRASNQNISARQVSCEHVDCKENSFITSHYAYASYKYKSIALIFMTIHSHL